MSEVVERNDVDVSKLFNWGRAFEIVETDKEGNATPVTLVFMKLLGDADLNRARVYAIRKSAEFRRKLKDQNSDERIAYIRDIDEVEFDDLVNLITVFSSREITNNARKSVRIQSPKPPKSDATLEEQEKFQKAVDEYPEKRAAEIAKVVEKEIGKLKKEIGSKSKEELYKDYVKLLIDEFCERESLTAFKDMQVYLGCYKDDEYKEKFFSSFDEFDNLEPITKQRFKDAYESLDIPMDELKKLRRATL